MLLADRNGKYPPHVERIVEQLPPYLALGGTRLTSSSPEVVPQGNLTASKKDVI